ncbi:hypothetical protein ACFL3Q_05665 [Planctomycetota bacterium]
MKTKTNKATTKITVHIEIETLFIMSPCYRPEQLFIIRVEQNTPFITNQLYKLPELLSTKNVTKWVRKYIKKEGFYVLNSGNNYSEEEKNDNWLADALKGEFSGGISHSLKRNLLWELSISNQPHKNNL